MTTQEKYEKALRYEIFNKEEYSFSKSEIIKASCIFDIGGHVGYFSERCNTLNPNAEIHYFEPLLDLYEKAKGKLGNNKNIILNNCGVNFKCGSGTMLVNKEKTMQSSKYPSFLNPNGVKTDVNFISLVDYIKDKKINHIDVFKIDIEGMEFDVLPYFSSSERLIIQNLILEVHLINEEFQNSWKGLFNIIKNNFGSIEIIDGYRKEIFLLRAKKN